MTATEGRELAWETVRARAPHLWIEVLAPVEIAGPLIVDALERTPMLPVGIVIARSRYGSIVLNQVAWTFLHPMLSAIPGLRTRHAPDETRDRSAVDQEPAQTSEAVPSMSIDAFDEADAVSIAPA
jgi:hypothetical protein